MGFQTARRSGAAKASTGGKGTVEEKHKTLFGQNKRCSELFKAAVTNELTLTVMSSKYLINPRVDLNESLICDH